MKRCIELAPSCLHRVPTGVLTMVNRKNGKKVRKPKTLCSRTGCGRPQPRYYWLNPSGKQMLMCDRHHSILMRDENKYKCWNPVNFFLPSFTCQPTSDEPMSFPLTVALLLRSCVFSQPFLVMQLLLPLLI